MAGRLHVKAASAAVALLSMLPVVAYAVPITNLFNTGVNASGTPLANNAAELHYTLISVPSGSTSVRVATSANGFPIPPWLGDNALSAWIGPTGAADLTGPVGNYDYRTTFQLSALEAAGATIDGQWSVDNTGTSIMLNGVSVANTAVDFKAFYTLSVHSGFVAGNNTLDFIVNNSGGPTGLRTQLVGAIAIDEPVSVVLLVTGLFGVSVARCRRGLVTRRVLTNLREGLGEGYTAGAEHRVNYKRLKVIS